MELNTLNISRLAGGKSATGIKKIKTKSDDNEMMESFQRRQKEAVELLKKVGLLERREHLPFQLSAGEQQRVAISRALSNDPPIIFGDEITANLDKRTSEFIRDIFKDLKAEKKTIIIATHDDKLIDLADKIIEFDDGKIVSENNK